MYHLAMRTHRDIIAEAGGPTKLAERIAVERWLAGAWKREDSIPAAYWPRLVDAGLATLDDLAHAAEARKFPEIAAGRRTASPEGAAA